MPPEIKLVISHNAKVVQTLKHALDEQGFVKSIEDFQILANATMTKLIEESGDIGQSYFNLVQIIECNA